MARLATSIALVAMVGIGASSVACSASLTVPLATATAPLATATFVVSPAPTPGASSPSPAGAGQTRAAASVTIDPTLLDVLPTTVSGLPVAAIAKPAGADDPALAETVDRMAQAFVIDPATSDFAYSSVIALRPGVFSAAYFRSWRDSFDEGACSQAGGVVGHAETTIGGRPVYVGRCAGGVTTYHVRLDGADEIVSISALGEDRLGELLLADLRP